MTPPTTITAEAEPESEVSTLQSGQPSPISSHDPEFIRRQYHIRREHYAHRDATGREVRATLKGEYDISFRNIVAPGERPVIGNMLSRGAMTITQGVGLPPRVQAVSRSAEIKGEMNEADYARKSAELHERTLDDYLDEMDIEPLYLQAAYWLITHDAAPLILRPSPQLHIPVIEVRDPLTAYPSTSTPSRATLTDCLFATEHPAWEAAYRYPAIRRLLDSMDSDAPQTLTLGEWHDGGGCTLLVLEPFLLPLRFYPAPTPGFCNVFLARGASPDGGFHGQFDQSIAPLITMAKMWALVTAYFEQQVAAETVVIGNVSSNGGRWATGLGAVNQLDAAPGVSVAKLVNQIPAAVFSETDRIERFLKIGAGIDSQMQGESPATIATGKGLEQLATAFVDKNIIAYQNINARQFRQAFAAIPRMARAMYSPHANRFSDDVKIVVKHHALIQPGQVVRALQLLDAKLVDDESLMSELPEVKDPTLTKARIDASQLRDVILQGLAADLANHQITTADVAEIIRLRLSGKSMEDARLIVEQQIQEAMEEAQQSQMGEMGAPGEMGPEGLPGQAPPSPLPLDQILQAASGPAAPPFLYPRGSQ